MVMIIKLAGMKLCSKDIVYKALLDDEASLMLFGGIYLDIQALKKLSPEYPT